MMRYAPSPPSPAWIPAPAGMVGKSGVPDLASLRVALFRLLQV